MRSDTRTTLLGNGCVLTIFAVNLCVGGVALRAVAYDVLGAHLPWLPAIIAGLFLGQFAVPAAVACWVASLCGVHVPFVHR